MRFDSDVSTCGVPGLNCRVELRGVDRFDPAVDAWEGTSEKSLSDDGHQEGELKLINRM